MKAGALALGLRRKLTGLPPSLLLLLSLGVCARERAVVRRPAAPAPATIDSRAQVTIDSESPPDAEPWGRSCLIHRKCNILVEALHPCPAGARGQAWSELSGSQVKPIGKRVSVRGPLTVGPVRDTLSVCSELDDTTGKRLPLRGCCANSAGAEVGVAGTPPLRLQGFSCRGDDSRLCCNVSARGQTVIATGELADDPEMGSGHYRLTGNVRLCLTTDR